MNKIEAILNYQAVDLELREIEKELEKNPHFRSASIAKQKVVAARAKLEECEKRAEELMASFERTQAEYEKVAKKLSELHAGVAESDIEDDTVYSDGVLTKLDQSLQRLDHELAELKNKVASTIKTAQECIRIRKTESDNFTKDKTEYEKVLSTRKSQMEALRKRLAELAKAVDHELMERYDRLRKEKRIPALFEAKKEGSMYRCGRCHMELDLNTAEVLKRDRIIECESCHFLTYLKD